MDVTMSGASFELGLTMLRQFKMAAIIVRVEPVPRFTYEGWIEIFVQARRFATKIRRQLRNGQKRLWGGGGCGSGFAPA